MAIIIVFPGHISDDLEHYVMVMVWDTFHVSSPYSFITIKYGGKIYARESAYFWDVMLGIELVNHCACNTVVVLFGLIEVFANTHKFTNLSS